MEKTLNIALVAHDNMKRDLAEWVDWNWENSSATTSSVPELPERWLLQH